MKISIIGAAGTLGSCTTFNILVHKMATELVMIDPWKNMLKAHWMDLSTAVTGQDVKIRIGDDKDIAGSDIVILTAGAPSVVISSRKELLPGNLPIVKENAEKINRFCPEALVITATNPVDPLNYAMYLLSTRRDRRKFIGYSLNDTYRFRRMSALALGVSSRRVQGMVIGEHDQSQVLLFSTLSLDGKTVKIDDAFKQIIRRQVSMTLKDLESLQPKRTTGWTSAVGITALINAIINNTGEMIPCSAVLDGEYGYRRLSMTIPALLGKNGIQHIQELELEPDEKEGLEYSVRTLEPYMRYVEQNLGTIKGTGS
jgi:malate dehydrogenase